MPAWFTASLYRCTLDTAEPGFAGLGRLLSATRSAQLICHMTDSAAQHCACEMIRSHSRTLPVCSLGKMHGFPSPFFAADGHGVGSRHLCRLLANGGLKTRPRSWLRSFSFLFKQYTFLYDGLPMGTSSALSSAASLSLSGK